MKRVQIRQLANGRWLFIVYIAGRVVIIGECGTHERALEAASLA